MIPLPFWLTNVQFVISAFGVFAFFAAAWLNIDSWVIRKELKTGLRAGGFLLLALWSALHGIGLDSTGATIFSAAALFVGALFIAISYVLDKPPLQPKDLVKKSTIDQKKKIAQVVKGPPFKKPVALAGKVATAPLKAGAALAQKTLRRPMISSAPKLRPKPALRSETLVKLPKVGKRRQARLLVILTVILVVLIIIAAAAYLVWTRTNLFRAEPPAEEMPFVEVEEVPSVEPSPEPDPTPEAAPAPKPTVTVLDTETGFLNVRDGGSTTTEIISKINPTEEYELLEESEDGKWYKLQVDENTAGWAAARYLEKNAATPVSEEP